LILRSRCTLSTLATKRNDLRPRPGQRPSISLDDAPRRAFRLASVTASRCLDSASTTNVHVTSTRYRHHLWRLTRQVDLGEGEVLPPRRPGSTPDHLAVIRPPAAACLTARPPASARSTAAWTLSRPAGELRRFFGSPDALSTDILWYLVRAAGRGPGEGVTSNRLITARRGHVNARRLAPRSRYLPSHGTEPDALSGARRGALHRLAGLRSFRAFSPVCEDTG
jgi:hypothetical protein